MPVVLINLIIWIFSGISGISLLIILTGVNPFEADIKVIVLFFLSFFIFLSAAFSLIGSYVREAVNKKSKPSFLISSIRQGSLISLYSTSILLMYATDTIAAWQAILLALVVVLLELYFR